MRFVFLDDFMTLDIVGTLMLFEVRIEIHKDSFCLLVSVLGFVHMLKLWVFLERLPL